MGNTIFDSTVRAFRNAQRTHRKPNTSHTRPFKSKRYALEVAKQLKSQQGGLWGVLKAKHGWIVRDVSECHLDHTDTRVYCIR